MAHDELKKKWYLLGERIVFTQNDNYGTYVVNMDSNYN